MKVTIAIPAHNQEKTIAAAIKSAAVQDYPDKEILVIDDASSDSTVFNIKYPMCQVRLIQHSHNIGIGGNLTRCMKEAKGQYTIFLCGDDMFTHNSVVGDMVSIFETNPRVGVIGRPYYQFIDGYEGAVSRCDSDILVSSSNPSGIGYRTVAMRMFRPFPNKIFVENMAMVRDLLEWGWEYKMMDYDTVAVRLHPNNTCVVSNYYNEAPVVAVNSVIKGFVNYSSFVSVKNRAPRWLQQEIFETMMIRPWCIFNPKFWFYALLAEWTPRWLLIRLCNFWRHRIARRWCKIKERGKI